MLKNVNVKTLSKRLFYLVMLSSIVILGFIVFRYFKNVYQHIIVMENQAIMLTNKVSEITDKPSNVMSSKDHFDQLNWMTLSMGLNHLSMEQVERLRDWTQNHHMACQSLFSNYFNQELSLRQKTLKDEKSFDQLEVLIDRLHATKMLSDSHMTKDKKGWFSIFSAFFKVTRRSPSEGEVWLNHKDLQSFKLAMLLQIREAKHYFIRADRDHLQSSLDRSNQMINRYLGRSDNAKDLQYQMNKIRQIPTMNANQYSLPLMNCLISAESK